MLIQDSNVTVLTADFDKAIGFYRKIGFVLKNRWANHYAHLSAPGITLGLHSKGVENTGSGTVSIGFVTDDFEAAKLALQEQNIRFEARNEQGGQFLHFTDPDGTALYFIKPKG